MTLPITGYVDRWSVRPGEPIRFMVSVQGGGRYRARIARVLCADPNPAGPGYREVPVPWSLEGEHDGEEQPIRLGSRIDIPHLSLPPGRLTFAATIWPTRIHGNQAVLAWQGVDAIVVLGVNEAGAFCRLVTPAGEYTVSTGMPLTERAWHNIACTVDPASLQVTQHPLKPRLDRDEHAEARADTSSTVCGPGRATIAATREGHHFNGKIEHPHILIAPDQVVAAWNFALCIDSDTITDTGPAAAHGVCINLPTRAMTSSNWRGNVHRWTEDPAQYAAIHFHDDDLGDAGWTPSLAFDIPQDWPSGVYALHLEHGPARDNPARDNPARNNIVFYVRAPTPGAQARVAFLAPTFSYTVYGQFARPGRQASIDARAHAWGALPQSPDGHPEYGISPYNHHSDGSGVAMASMRRPMVDKRVNHIELFDQNGSGLYWVGADSYITDLLDRGAIPFEVITDHDVHAEGAALLANYAVVLTGQHPEYHTTETLDALSAYLDHGGRFMYLGGNGFYWKTVPHPSGLPSSPPSNPPSGSPSCLWAFEVRRAEGGIRLWETLPGEGHHAFDGSYGGLWRRLGRPPQALVGVGFSTQGEYRGYPYTVLDAILDPRVAFMRPGLEPGQVLGERGLMGGGAAGHELDRADVTLGTPAHALIIARAIVTDPSYQPVNEERFDHTWPAPREAIIRSDITYFETPAGGAVFSVGSMNFIGALPIDGYENPAACLIRNVVLRFSDPTPLRP